MDWKEFFKPTFGKIILFLILSIIFVPFIIGDISGVLGRVRETTYPLIYLLIKRFTIHKIPYNNALGVHYPYLIMGLIISYLVSCLIVLTINKIRNKST